MARERADRALVARGLFESRARAQEAIAAGLVAVNGRVIAKPSEKIGDDDAVTAAAPHPWASRGGVKLARALDHFGIEPAGWTCVDLGASTGGFTDVLLSRGAARVLAVDVGHGQLHPRIAADPRVVSLEGQDARAVTPELMRAHGFGAADMAVMDLSFISLKLALPAVPALLAPQGTLVALIKPQFEAGRAFVDSRGLVRDPAVRRRVCDGVVALLQELGFAVAGVIPSPIAGGDGNEEFLAAARLAR
ncbi:TlyA family RNA methyltransferase [Camelimonas abortus]|uniref:TlyA family RNA methyltransferase n=1 Tax=Camelimonas abortus TaxID=1017184 RepID=A0ABV7LDI8_9HYPH